MAIRFLPSLKRGDFALYWLLLAVLSLTVSGIFAFLIALARTPVVSELFKAPDFFRRALVVHVDLGVSVWFTAFPVALFHLLNRSKKIELPAKIALSLSIAGVLLLALTGFSSLGVPYLSNYIPVISHPLFMLGLVLYFAGVAFNYFSSGLLNPTLELGREDSLLQQALWVSQVGIRVGALFFLASLATLVIASFNGPPGLSGGVHYEMLMWGGGHVLQFANIAFMLVCWTLLLSSWSGKVPITRSQSFFIFVWLGVPLLAVPWIAAQDIAGRAHREGFSLLMQWGIFPPVLAYLALTVPAAFRSKKNKYDVRFLSFVLSAVLVILGFVFGALVRGPDLRLPGHYHAAIGGVTASFMAAAYVVFKEFSAPHAVEGSRESEVLFTSKKAIFQSLFTGLGQVLFASGMFIAGSYGMARKVYGVEQQITRLGQSIGMWAMGAGGILALVGGVFFVVNIYSGGLFRMRSSR